MIDEQSHLFERNSVTTDTSAAGLNGCQGRPNWMQSLLRVSQRGRSHEGSAPSRPIGELNRQQGRRGTISDKARTFANGILDRS